MSAPLMTAEELLHANVPNKRTELVRGRLVVHEPPGGKHGNVTANLGARLWTYADLTRAGAVFAGYRVYAGTESRHGARTRYRVHPYRTPAAAHPEYLPRIRAGSRGRDPLTAGSSR